jgi:transcriptional regulator with XRE-family HTH domain
MSAFREFLEGQREVRQLSVPEFAEFLGISDTSLRNFIHKTNPKMPGRSALLKISEKTHTPFSTLIEMLDPESTERARSSANAQFLAELMEGLTEAQRKVVETVIDEFLRQNGGED